MKIFISIFFAIVALIGGGLYLTFTDRLPFITNAIFKQVELGVRETPDEIYAFYEELGYENNLRGESPKSGELVFKGSIDLEHTFSQSEINSWIAAWEKDWKDLPFQKSEIKINRDGTVEASTLISVSNAEAFAKTLGYSQEEINKAKDYIRFIPEPLPLYAKGTASITQNDVDIKIESLKVGRFTVPQNISSLMGPLLAGVVDRTRKLSQDTNINYATVTSEGVNFSGTVPASVDVK